MIFRRSHAEPRRLAWVGVTLIACLMVAGCLDTSAAKSSGSGGGSSGGSSGSTTSSASLDTYRAAKATKVIFNKFSFYNNQNPNPEGCAGDAKLFYDPQSDRQVPVKPDWITNVAVDVTNSNAFHGPSLTTGCGLSGLGAAQAANCAAFDDLQPITGVGSRSILVGGYGCISPTTGCSATYALGDIWNLSASDAATSSVWTPQSGSTPELVSGQGNASGLVWHGGDYDQLHDEFYTFGGAMPESVSANGTFAFSNNVNRLTFNSDGSLSTQYPPDTATFPTTPRIFYAGWSKPTFTAPFIANPTARVGASFTYGLRRDPTTKSWCASGDAIGGTTCSSTSITTPSPAIASNEHDDYFLLVGGMLGSPSGGAKGLFSKNIYMFKPHAFSDDVGTGGTAVQPWGDWITLSNASSPASPPDISTQVMSIVDLSPQASLTIPYAVTPVGGTTPAGDVFSGWVGSAYHRTVYDPTMNRFYIYGGLINSGALSGAPVSASTSIPSLSTSDIWIYDPPALGRRPTAACNTHYAPDVSTLPVPNAGVSKLMGAATNLDVNRNYGAAPFVFPPGGCLQRISLPTKPAARFEHAMAFDRSNGTVLMYGGCNAPGLIPADHSASAGDPTTNCNSSNSLLSDLWMYIPPVTTEVVSQTNYTTSTTSPYNSSTLLANIFDTDFWLDHLPLYAGGNSPGSGSLSIPTTAQTLGTWVQLTPPGSLPPARASASLVYDDSHHRFYLQGGYGCGTVSCPQALNDLWVYTPPNVNTDCDRDTGVCGNQGSWQLVQADNQTAIATQPTERKGGTMANATPIFSYGDSFYTVTDTQCVGQGPIATNDASVSKQYVGAVYIDIDRNQLTANENLLINLRFAPFDQNSRLAAWSDNGTRDNTSDDSDSSETTDTAIIRVQLLSDGLRFGEQIQSLLQPRFHEFVSGTPIIADTFVYASGATGQITEKQIHIPLSLDPSINLIKIERVQGSVKFFEMTLSRF